MAVLAGADDKKEQVNAVSGRYSKKSRGILYFVGKHIYIFSGWKRCNCSSHVIYCSYLFSIDVYIKGSSGNMVAEFMIKEVKNYGE